MNKWEPNTCTCSVTYTLSVVGGKWKWLMLFKLFKHGVLRYGELKNTMPAITHKMLSQQLKELEAAELIFRKQYNQIPPKVEYRLTELGLKTLPIVDQLAEFGLANLV